jgi:hypothetical protein
VVQDEVGGIEGSDRGVGSPVAIAVVAAVNRALATLLAEYPAWVALADISTVLGGFTLTVQEPELGQVICVPVEPGTHAVLLL